MVKMNVFCIFMHPKRALLQIKRLKSELSAVKEENYKVISAQREALRKMRVQLQEKDEKIAGLEYQLKELQAQSEERLRGGEPVTFNEIVDEWLNGKEEAGG